MVEVVWAELDEEDEGWDEVRCLYAYIDPESNDVLYIGKAWGKTVRERFDAPDKDQVFARLEAAGYDVDDEGVGVLIGRIMLEPGMRLTEAFLKDVESLLIYEIEPEGNEQNIYSRGTWRSGLEVRCQGDWRHPVNTFVDEGQG
jgi:hypothetical protein